MVKNPLIALAPEFQTLVVPPISYAIVLVPLALLVYLMGDLIPAAIGRSRSATLAPIVALPARALVVVLGPLVRLLLVVDYSPEVVPGGS